MALVDLPLPLTFGYGDYASIAPTLASANIATLNYGRAIIFEMPFDDTIEEVAFKTAAITAGGNLEYRIETVNTATYLPTGTLIDTDANVTVALTTSDDDVYMPGTITTPPTIAAGTLLAVVMRVRTASMGTMNLTGNGFQVRALPVSGLDSTGSAWVATAAATFCYIKFGTRGYAPLPSFVNIPLQSVVTNNYDNATTPDIYGNAFTPPFDCTISGAQFLGDIDGSFYIRLYDSDGVTVVAETEVFAGLGNTTGVTKSWHSFDPVNLTSGVTYFLVSEPSTASNIINYTYTFPSAAIKAQFCDGVLEACSAKTPTGPGDWTITDTACTSIWPLISAIDSGGGGSLAIPVSGGKIR